MRAQSKPALGKDPSHNCIEDIPLITVDQTRDLGVIIDSDLKFRLHIDNITHKASVRSRLILKSFTYLRDKNLLIKAFCVCVRPLLKYSCQVWNHHHKYLIESIEKIQKKFTKAIPGVGQLGYLKASKLKSLEHHRLVADLSLLYKIINNLISTDLINHIHFTCYTSTREHQLKLKPDFCSIDSTKYFFTNRAIKIWNSLQ